MKGELFPIKLHRILNDATEKGFDHVIGWCSDGRSFVIHNKERMEKEVMSFYFSTDKFKSFQRSLNLWGFQKVGKSVGGHCHPLFIRGRVALCEHMRRERIKQPGARKHLKDTTAALASKKKAEQESSNQDDTTDASSTVLVDHDTEDERMSMRSRLRGNTTTCVPSSTVTRCSMIPKDFNPSMETWSTTATSATSTSQQQGYPLGLTNRFDHCNHHHLSSLLPADMYLVDTNVASRLLLAALFATSNNSIQAGRGSYYSSRQYPTVQAEESPASMMNGGVPEMDSGTFLAHLLFQHRR